MEITTLASEAEFLLRNRKTIEKNNAKAEDKPNNSLNVGETAMISALLKINVITQITIAAHDKAPHIPLLELLFILSIFPSWIIYYS